jgi:thioredoxin-like negative regulator of GroEL
VKAHCGLVVELGRQWKVQEGVSHLWTLPSTQWWMRTSRTAELIIKQLAKDFCRVHRKESIAVFCGAGTQVKLNTDESPTVATEYGIRSIPTVMIFKGGKKMDSVIGAVPKNALVQTIEKYVD